MSTVENYVSFPNLEVSELVCYDHGLRRQEWWRRCVVCVMEHDRPECPDCGEKEALIIHRFYFPLRVLRNGLMCEEREFYMDSDEFPVI